MGQGIVFGESSDGPWIIGVTADLTPYDTTEDWLNKQPKGNASSVGYEFLRWVGPKSDGKALVFQYVGPGNDGKCEKRFIMLNMEDKSLYTLEVSTWFEADAAVTLDPDIEHALETFQATGLVTTNSSGSYRTIRNWDCDATFRIPPDWVDRGYLGESKIVSPEDQRTNEEWNATHQDLIQNAEGDGPIGPDARSLYISCQEADTRSHSDDKKLNINGLTAYEVVDAGKMPDGTSVTNYTIVLGKEKTMMISLGETEYDKLPDTVKQIIQSISFEK